MKKPLKIDYEIDIVPNEDFVDIYAVAADGSTYLLRTITGTDTGSISTVLPTGKAKIQFRINTGWGGNYYDGLTALYAEDNVTNTTVSNNAYVSQNLSVLGDAGIGTASTSSKRLAVSGANHQYGIYSANNTTYRVSYGIYSTVSGTGNSANVYGLYSTVSCTAPNKWAGYFTGGNVEVTGGILKANDGLIVASGDVGIGTTTPQYKLDISGTSRTTGNAIFNGNVGIGTTSPQCKLDVAGKIRSTDAVSISRSDVNVGGVLELLNPTKTAAGQAFSWKIYNMGGIYGNSLQFWAYDQLACESGGMCVPRLALMDNGNVGVGTNTPHYKLDVDGTLRTAGNAIFNGKVGIGTSTPDEKLTVKGKIHTEEVIVNLNVPLADYVFAPGYQLMSLPEVENYVKTNSRLPDMPSAEEVKEKGLNTGAMLNKLLQTVEEQMLYIIALEKRIAELEKK